MIRLVILFCSIFFSLNLSLFAQSKPLSSDSYNADDIVGIWSNSDNIMKVKIEKIGSHYFGKLIWLEKPKEPDGSPKLDKHNPDPSLRSVPFIGLRVMKDMKYKGNGVWSGGTLYDPEKGKTYGCKISLVNMNVASIRGFIGVALLGKSEKFSRVGK
jgi:uncharacterized protein (DUF2147 family)